MLYLLCGLGILSVGCGGGSAYLALKGRHGYRLLIKSVASALFVAIAFIAFINARAYSAYSAAVLAALVFGMLGDIFLAANDIAEERYKLIAEGLGLICFLAGHVLFVISFASSVKFNAYLLPLLALLPLVLVFLQGFKFITMNKAMFAAIMAYGIGLGLMSIFAINYFISDQSAKGILILIAGLLFPISDTMLLIRDKASLPKPVHTVMMYAVLIIYFAAQALFALTVYFN